MTDIVERLRGITAMDPAWCDPDCARFAKAASMAMADAAEEIKRLRTEIAAHNQQAEDAAAHSTVLTEKLAQAWRERDMYRSRLLQASEPEPIRDRLQPILDGTVGVA